MKNEFDYLNDVKMDFSIYDAENATETEIIKMGKNVNKKRLNHKKPYLIAACITVIALTGTAFASGIVSNVIKTISTGHNTFVSYDASIPEELPEQLMGKFYDKNGNPIASMASDESVLDGLYDADGNKLTAEDIQKIYEDAFGDKVKITLADEEDADANETIYSTIEEAEVGAEFDIKVPEYLPEGYALDSIECYNDNEGNPSGKYRTLLYKNSKGNEIYFFERLINDETAYAAGVSEQAEEIMIQGRTAVLDRTSLDWETEDNVSVGISVHDSSISRDELIKIGENVK